MVRLKIGIFGGTFDPPHIAHLILAGEAQHQLQLDRLLWVLTPDPPHKQGKAILPLEPRLDMLQAALGQDETFELSRVEIDRPPPHYALDTVRLVQQANPGAEVIYLMGGDSLHDLPTWHRPLDLLEACTALGVMRRPYDQVNLKVLEEWLPGITQKIRFVISPLIEISATGIRRRVAEGQPYRYFLPEGVWRIIEERGLYRES
jgi:nicotinate-nucleotide adenylyltransferase